MGGYGAFIWPAYLVTAAVMVGILWASLRTGRRQRDLMDVLTSERRARRPGAER
jgi:heme exporter protein D